MGSVIGFTAGLVVTTIAAATGGRDATWLGLVLVAGATATIAAATTLAGALAAAGQCWAFWDGFLVNGLGRLDTGRGGWQGLLLLLGCAVAAHLTGVAWRHFTATSISASPEFSNGWSPPG